MQPKINLDDNRVYAEIDPSGMREHIRNIPSLCQKAWQAALDFKLPAELAGVNKVVVLGMGGSAIGGDLVASLALKEARLPVMVLREYELPPFVDGQTLVIASSYSGTTEETLTAFTAAGKAGAKRLALTTGGELKKMAEADKVPVFTIDYQAPPRAALPFSMMPLLCFFQRLGFVSDKSGDVARMVAETKSLTARLDIPTATKDNAAKEMATVLSGKLPVIYGADIFSQVARRWKTQFNENSKAWSFFEVFPELNHNAVVGYEYPKELLSQVVIIMLRSPSLPERLRRRMEITAELLKKAGADARFVDAGGTNPLSRMMSTILFGDFTSYYLAILSKVDPMPVRVIDFLKEALKKPAS